MRRVLCLFFLIASTAGIAHAQNAGTGVGVIVGEPTGLSLKHWIDGRSAVDGALGVGFDRGSSFHVHANWLWHDFSLMTVDRGAMPVHFGIGARYKAGSDGRGKGHGRRDRLGVRVPVGVAYHFDDKPLEIFGEIAPILDVAPSMRLGVNAAVGVRWFFD